MNLESLMTVLGTWHTFSGFELLSTQLTGVHRSKTDRTVLERKENGMQMGIDGYVTALMLAALCSF